MFLDATRTNCPYCGETIELLYEPMDTNQEYYEDCQVCCQPILVKISALESADQPRINFFRADETD